VQQTTLIRSTVVELFARLSDKPKPKTAHTLTLSRRQDQWVSRYVIHELCMLHCYLMSCTAKYNTYQKIDFRYSFENKEAIKWSVIPSGNAL